MPWKSTYFANFLLDYVFNGSDPGVLTPWASLHTGHPGLTGTAEVVGGSYGRVDVSASFPAAASSAISSNADISWTGMPSATIFYVGIFDASTSGNFIGYAPIEAVFGYGTANATDDKITNYSHGLSADDRVVVNQSIGDSLPTGLSENTLYYAHTILTDSFQLSTAAGGSGPVDITASGEVVYHKVVGKTVNASDTVTITSTNLNFFEET